VIRLTSKNWNAMYWSDRAKVLEEYIEQEIQRALTTLSLIPQPTIAVPVPEVFVNSRLVAVYLHSRGVPFDKPVTLIFKKGLDMIIEPLYHDGMSADERKKADKKFDRLMNLVADKLVYLPEKHKADIRKLLEELAS
jgi:hypothetical protein